MTCGVWRGKKEILINYVSAVSRKCSPSGGGRGPGSHLFLDWVYVAQMHIRATLKEKNALSPLEASKTLNRPLILRAKGAHIDGLMGGTLKGEGNEYGS